jgi:hypothetical protein
VLGFAVAAAAVLVTGGGVLARSVPPAPQDVISVDVVLDPVRQAELDPNYIAIVAYVTDAAGEPVEREYALRATARTGDVVDDTVFHLGYPHREDPAAEAGRYPGVVIVPYGGSWTISVNVFDRISAESDAIPLSLARAEVSLDVDAPFLPAAAAQSSGGASGASGTELLLRIAHALIGMTWFAVAGLLAMAGMSRPILRSGDVGDLIERNLGRLTVGLVWVTGLVWLTGVLSLRIATAFDPPLSPDQAERLFRVPYARAYMVALGLKVATSAALTIAAVPIVRRARRVVARSAEPSARNVVPLAVAIGGATVLVCVSVLTYLHTVSERVAG